MELTIEQKQEFAQQLANLREDGSVNMYSRIEVISYLVELGYETLAVYLYDNKDKYMELLELPGNY